MHLSRHIAITGPAVVITVLIPAAVTVAAPTHPPDPASTARAIAGDRAASLRAARPIAPAVASTRVAVPWPDGPTWATARAIARHQVASFGPMRPTAPAAIVTAPTPPPHPAVPARVVARDPAHTFRALRPIAPAAASTRVARSRPDGPTWGAALVAGTLAAAVAAGLGLAAGRRTVRVQAD